jgi:hypothetical protein
MSKMIVGSLNLSKILAKAKEKHSAFSKAENGDLYFNLIVWENDEKDKYGNDFSIQLNPKKGAEEIEKKQYIGNMKRVEGGGASAPLTTSDDIPSAADLPF